MRKLLLLIFLAGSLVASAQPGNYMWRKTRERIYAGMFDSSLHIPSYNGVPSGLRSGSAVSDGAVAIDTANHYFYYYSNGGWIKSAKYTDITAEIKIDTVNNYTQLRSYAGAAKVLVNTDSRTGGVFYYTGGTENGATIIDGWQRIFDGVHYKPEWFELQGKDKDGNSYNRLTGAGIGSEADAIDNICRLAGKDAVIEYQPGKTYAIDRAVEIIQNQTHINGTWQRATPVWTLISNNELLSSTSIEVADASNLQAGMSFLIKAAGTDGSFGDNSNNVGGTEFHTILSISGNTLTISNSVNPIARNMTAGDTLVTVAPMLFRKDAILGASDSNYIVRCINMTFDGNKAANRFFIDYQQPVTIEAFGGYIIAENCTFKNTPGENIYGAGGRLTNCFAYQLEGSVIHGTNNIQTIDSIYREFIVTNLVADSIGLGNAALQGHSEATLYVNSTKTSNAKFINATVTNAGGAAGPAKPLWNGNADDGIIQVFGGVFQKSRALIDLSGMDSSTAKGSRIIIKDATFDNCGWAQITGTDAGLRRGNGLKDILIDNNSFTNTRWYFAEVVGLQFTNNKVYTDSSTYRRWDDTRAAGDDTTTFFGVGQASLFLLSPYADRVTITGNTFEGFRNDSIATGLMVQLYDSAYSKVGTTQTNYYYAQNYNISDNTLADFRFATSLNITSFAKAALGWKMNGNIIYMNRHSDYVSDYCYGLQVPPGATARFNTVYNYHNSNYSYAIMAYGVKGTGQYTKIPGAIVADNTVYGKGTHQIYIDPFGTSPYNVTVVNNLTMNSAVTGSVTGLANSFRSGNNVLDVTNLPSLTAYEVPVYHRIKENKSNY